MSAARVEHQQLAPPQQQNLQASNLAPTIRSIQSLSLQLNQVTSFGPSGYLEHQLLEQKTPMMSASLASGALTPGGQRDSEQASASMLAHNKLGRLVGKKASRVKEVLLQNLGRAERTTDELFEMYEENFYRQQGQANKLAKEFRQYMGALKGFQEANKSLNSCIQTATSDYQSARHDLVCENLSQLEQLNEDLIDKLRNQVMQTVGEYLSQFVELKEKISKRRRKLIDFDSSKRAYEITLAQVNKKRLRQQRAAATSEQSNEARGFGMRFIAQQIGAAGGDGGQHPSDSIAPSQLVDEARLLKLREQYNYCKVMYETINSELHEELPIVYEKKMKSLLNTLQNYFALEAHYYSNAGKLLATTSDVISELPTSFVSSARAARSSSDDDFDEDDHYTSAAKLAADKLAHEERPAGNSSNGGGASSSGLGSSQADSSSCPETSSSGAGSPDSAQAQQSAHNQGLDQWRPSSGSGKELGLAGEEAEVWDQPESQPGPTVGGLHEPTCAAAGPPASAGPDAYGDRAQGPTESEAKQDAYGEQQSVDALALSGEFQTTISLNPREGLERAEDDTKPQDQQASTEEENRKLGEGESCTIGQEPQLDTEVPRSPGFLYRVKTNYKYLAEDVDELCFESGEILQVVEFGASQEPEEGWLMGVREMNGQRGLFPANFTVPI